MAYTDDAVKAKLSSLNETQESIVTVAQWIMFHRRHADRTAQMWLQRLKDSASGKRLNLIYLANEVVQQSKARKKDEFLIAFSPIIAEGTAIAYKGAPGEIQTKVRRVIEVWRQRLIFDMPIQEAVEARVNEIDKTRSSGKKQLMGGSLFSSSSVSSPTIPNELQSLVPAQIAVTKAVSVAINVETTAKAEYDKLMDPSIPSPTPPVHAARLSALLKSLANAEGAVSESIKARRDLIDRLEKLLETNRTTLAVEESQLQELVDRKSTVDSTKRVVEDGIMRGLSDPSSLKDTLGLLESNGNGDASIEPERPQIEELTPPPMESVTPVGSPFPGDSLDDVDFDVDLMQSTSGGEATDALTSSLSGPTSKKRKIGDSDVDQFADGERRNNLDEDVAELLRTESGGR